jgi:hypothetical protein
MNSNKVIVSGKNATTSVFITLSQHQKEEAERLEYEISNSYTSTEEEDKNELEVVKNQLEVVKNQSEAVIKSLKQTIRDLHVSLSKMTKQYNKKTLELKDERIFRRDNEDNFFRLLDEHRRLEKTLKNVTL